MDGWMLSHLYVCVHIYIFDTYLLIRIGVANKHLFNIDLYIHIHCIARFVLHHIWPEFLF